MIAAKRIRWSLAAALALAWAGPARADPDALWKIVHNRCVPGEEQRHDPAPCALVHLDGGIDRGYAALKDINGVAQFLLIPTERIVGIEDPVLQRPDAPNFFADAWDIRNLVSAQLGRPLPRDGYGLVINSIQGRTQEQFHIHVDCLRADVRDQIRAHAAEVPTSWAPFPVPLVSRRYMAMRVPGETLGPYDPIRLLADLLPGAAEKMGLHTLIVVGSEAAGQPDFVLLDREVTKEVGDRGNGTELLDRACTPARDEVP